MRKTLLALVLLAAGLAGCSEQAGAVPVPVDMAGELPEGFVPVAFDPAGVSSPRWASPP